MRGTLGGRAIGSCGIVAAVAIALAGCAAAPAPPPATVYVTTTATAEPPSPTPASAASTVTIDPAPTAPAPSPNAPAPVLEWGPATDNGATTGATGPAVSDANGQMISYTVAAGDDFFDIAQRFDLPQQQLLRMNPQIHDFGEAIYIGQLINLDWTKTG